MGSKAGLAPVDVNEVEGPVPSLGRVRVDEVAALVFTGAIVLTVETLTVGAGVDVGTSFADFAAGKRQKMF